MSEDKNKPAALDDEDLDQAQGGASIGAAQKITVGASQSPTIGMSKHGFDPQPTPPAIDAKTVKFQK